MKKEYLFIKDTFPFLASKQLYKHTNPICDMHIHSELEFLYVVSGRFKCNIENKSYIAEAGDIIIVNSNISHSTQALVEPTEILMIQTKNISLTSDTRQYLSEILSQSYISAYLLTPKDEEYLHLKNCLQNIYDTKTRTPATNCYIMANIYMIYSILYDKNFFTSGEFLLDNNLINKLLPVFDYIDENYSENITLDTLADIIYMSNAYLCRLFKKATNITIFEYLNYVRISKATALLKNHDNISHISNAVGFSSVSYFSKTFKKYKRYSPAKYKKLKYNSADVMHGTTKKAL